MRSRDGRIKATNSLMISIYKEFSIHSILLCDLREPPRSITERKAPRLVGLMCWK